MPFTELDRINIPADANPVTFKHASRSDACIAVHAGWGIEDEVDACGLVEPIHLPSDRHKIPTFIETHRATITEHLRGTVQIANCFREVRSNGDISHYLCGQESVFGDWETKLEFTAPIFSPAGYLHGRVANPGGTRVPVDENLLAKLG
jgi:hypothetical protein